MATEENKKANALRLSNLTLFGLTAGVWDYLGESSFAISDGIGSHVLELMEKEMGLEIAGESMENVLEEMQRLFVDEFGIAEKITHEVDGKVIKMYVQKCANRELADMLVAAGVGKPFICPIMNATQAVLKRIGHKARVDVERWVEGSGSIITLTLIG
jgi:hypothetical protein